MIPAQSTPIPDPQESERIRRLLTIPESRPGALGEMILAAHLRHVPVRLVMDCLLDPSEPTRILATEVLFNMGSGGVEGLAGALSPSQPSSVRISGAMALGRLGTEAAPAAEPLAACAQAEDSLVQLHAGLALSRIGPSALPHLISLLDSSNETAVRTAATALARMGEQATDALESLQSLAGETPSSEVRISCLQAITAIQGDPATGILKALPLLDDEDPDVRRACLDALRESGVTETAIREKVTDKLQDPVGAIRGSAALTLARVQPDAKAAVPALVTLLSDEDLDVRAHAAMALAHYGPEAAEALDPLTTLKEVDAPWLQAVVQAASTRIRGESSP